MYNYFSIFYTIFSIFLYYFAYFQHFFSIILRYSIDKNYITSVLHLYCNYIAFNLFYNLIVNNQSVTVRILYIYPLFLKFFTLPYDLMMAVGLSR